MASKKTKSAERNESANVTLEQAVPEFMEHLKEQGKSEKTIFTYGKDLDLALEFFGKDKAVSAIRPADVGRFFKSDLMNKLKSGKDKASPTILKAKRVFRQLMVLCVERGYIETIPIPKDELPKGRVPKAADEPADNIEPADENENA